MPEGIINDMLKLIGAAIILALAGGVVGAIFRPGLLLALTGWKSWVSMAVSVLSGALLFLSVGSVVAYVLLDRD